MLCVLTGCGGGGGCRARLAARLLPLLLLLLLRRLDTARHESSHSTDGDLAVVNLENMAGSTAGIAGERKHSTHCAERYGIASEISSEIDHLLL